MKIEEIKFEYALGLVEEYCKKHWDTDWRKATDKFSLNKEAYIQLNEQGMLKTFVAFHEEYEPIGYCNVVVSPGMHTEAPVAIVDAFFVEEEYRGKGVAQKLLERAGEACKDLGVIAMNIGFRAGDDKDSKLIERMGFEHVETTYSKIL